MSEDGPRVKYRLLPPNIDIKDMVIEVNTERTEVEHSDKPDPIRWYTVLR
jgi:hypothetical protein